MKRSSTVVAVLTAVILSLAAANAGGPFDQKLSPDRQIVQALNRLSFGPRPGDVEEVRRVGLNKWIEQQLHPDQIAENPVLEARLKPLESLRMELRDVVKDYTPQQNQGMMVMNTFQPLNQLLPQADMRKVQNGTAEQRTEVLKALDPEKRRQVLATLSPDILEYTPEFKKEGEEARRMQQEEQQRQNRLRSPPLADILSPDQLTAINAGSKDQIIAVLAYLDPEKRKQVVNVLGPQKLADLPELRRESQFRRQPWLVASEDLKEAKVFRAIYSNRQLEEVLVDFWVNHFNVDVTKNVQSPLGPNVQNLMHLLLGSYERDAIRPHVLGHFKDLLLAAARHPAMLYYLDNWESLAPDSFNVGPFAPRRGTFNGVPNSILPGPLGQIAHGLNENYGREVMELHTLGVKGGYTQDDVIAVARCFTGWTVSDPEDPKFVFAPFMHDSSEKTVLGHKIPAGRGEQDGLDVIDILAHHPSTAKFISRELAQRFVADDPPQALVDRMAQTFTKTDGDLRAVLETMFTSPEFFSEGAWQSKLKSPFEMVVSAVRAMQGEVTDTYALVQKIADLGEPLYSKLAPTGYPNTGEPWLSTQGVMGRMNFSASLASGLFSGVKVDPAKLEGKDSSVIARELLGRDASPPTLAALEQGLDPKQSSPLFIASLVLGSPDFQRR
jgi:uncharacterized protein (DUF1800 family)